MYKWVENRKKIQSDLERALWGKEDKLNKGGLQLKEMGIELYNVGNAFNGKHSAPIVERLQRTQNDFMHH